MDSADVIQPTCPHCNGIVHHDDSFCGACGKEIVVVQNADALAHSEDAFEALKPTLAYYGITLLLLASYKLTSLFPGGFDGMLIVTVIDTAIVLTFWILFHRQLLPLFSIKNIKPGLVALTVLGAMVGSVVVSVVADLINISISDDVFYSTYLFEDTSHPFLFAVFFIAVHPAIFEEVTFRGFMFTNVSHITTPKGAIYITGFVFGIIHLAVISLLWLVPIGLVFAWLRWKHNTLWYGIVGHFVYNLCITVMEYNGWSLF
jgi:uncharacterized protein